MLRVRSLGTLSAALLIVVVTTLVLAPGAWAFRVMQKKSRPNIRAAILWCG